MDFRRHTIAIPEAKLLRISRMLSEVMPAGDAMERKSLERTVGLLNWLVGRSHAMRSLMHIWLGCLAGGGGVDVSMCREDFALLPQARSDHLVVVKDGQGFDITRMTLQHLDTRAI